MARDIWLIAMDAVVGPAKVKSPAPDVFDCMMDEWNEKNHPRDGGKFSSGSGSGKKSSPAQLKRDKEELRGESKARRAAAPQPMQYSTPKASNKPPKRFGRLG